MLVLIANLCPDVPSHSGNSTYQLKFSHLHFPIGLGIIAAILDLNNIYFETYDSYLSGTTGGFLLKIHNEKYDIVLLSGFLGNYSYAYLKKLSFQIKDISPQTLIIIGGPIASTIPEMLISKTAIDYVVKGEGEETISYLLKTLKEKKEISEVKGIYYRDYEDTICFTGERERVKQLDMYPFPLYEAFEIDKYSNYLEKTDRCIEIIGSRGCFGKCRYCCRVFGHKVSRNSYEKIVEHMIKIFEKFGKIKFNFVDDNFLITSNDCDKFISALKQAPQEFKWRFQGRIDMINPKMVERMAKWGLYDISFGIESGSQKMIDIYNKKICSAKAFETIEAIKDIVDVHATFIVGGPGEDWSTVKETEQFIRKLRLNNSVTGILTLFPKTHFYDDALRDKVIGDEEEYFINLGPVYVRPYTNISNLSNDELIQARDMLQSTASEFGPYS